MPDESIMKLFVKYENQCLEYSYQRANRSKGADAEWETLRQVKEELLAAIESQAAKE